jgi:hypothetical protein
MAQPDPTNLIKRIGLTIPLIGFYDAPDTLPFEPLLRPKSGKRARCFCSPFLSHPTNSFL